MDPTQIFSLLSTLLPPSALIKHGVPSASIALLSPLDNKISSHILSTTSRETPKTLYQACSISKAICSLTIARLIDKKHTPSFDTFVYPYLPTHITKLYSGAQEVLLRKVTFGMLLSHTSGLSQHGFAGYHSNEVLPSAEQVLAGEGPANTLPVVFAALPGQRAQYAGGGYVILQIIIESIMGKTYQDVVREEIFTPLGMDRSTYGDIVANGEKDYAAPHFAGTSGSAAPQGPHLFGAEDAAGGLWTTPSDLVRALMAVQDSLEGGEDGNFLKQETARKMLEVPGAATILGPFALGWQLDGATFGHSGGNEPGYATHCFAGRGKDGERVAFAVMTNSYVGHDAVISGLTAAVGWMAGWTREEAVQSWYWRSDAFVALAAPEGTKVKEGWETWKGRWEDGWRIVDGEGGEPAVQFGGLPALKLRLAAVPAREGEFEFVVEGVRMGVQLAHEADERVIRLFQGNVKTLKRVS